jgi:predicted lipid-binding transport protein (Tim44 family)
MLRRSALTKTIFLAGLICLGMILSHRGWCRETTGAPALRERASPTEAPVLSQPILLAARQAPAAASKPEGVSAQKSISHSGNYRWLTGGLLGSLLCYYSYGYPLSMAWEEGVWPPGLLDLLVLIALAYLGYRLYRRYGAANQSPGADPLPRFLRMNIADPPALAVREEAKSGLAAIQETDQEFSVEAFGEETRNLLLILYDAWNREDFKGLNGRVRESLLEYLLMGLKIMSLREERSYLEDMVIDGFMVTDARVEDGKETITVFFRGRLLDYVLDKGSGKLLLGSMAYPATFQEYWELERPRGSGPWVLQDIRDG